jgi:hypothetical protein
MTEEEWLSATDPQPMLEVLRGKVSERKLRLFACACCRRIWRLLADQRCQWAVEVAELYADGKSSLQELREATALAWAAGDEYVEEQRNNFDIVVAIAISAAAYSAREAEQFAEISSREAHRAIVRESLGESEEVWDADAQAQCNLLSDIFGNPFHSVSLNPTWRSSAVVELGKAAYENRALPAGTLEPERIALLADALEYAGCTDAAILDHLRGPGPHVRGCHVIDALLGKQ